MKKILFVLLCIMLVSGLVACNKVADAEPSGNNKTESEMIGDSTESTEESASSELEESEMTTEESTQVQNNTEETSSEEVTSEEATSEESSEEKAQNTTPPVSENNNSSNDQPQTNLGYTLTEKGSRIYDGWELKDGVYYPSDLMPGGENYNAEFHAQWDGKTYAEFKAANSYGLTTATPGGGLVPLPDNYVIGSFAIYQYNDWETDELIQFCMGL